MNNFLAKASHRIMPTFEGKGKYNAPHAQKSGAQILPHCSNIFCNTGSLHPNTYMGVLESLSLVHGSLFGTRKDQGKIWKDDLRLLTLKFRNWTSVSLSSWQPPLSCVFLDCTLHVEYQPHISSDTRKGSRVMGLKVSRGRWIAINTSHIVFPPSAMYHSSLYYTTQEGVYGGWTDTFHLWIHRSENRSRKMCPEVLW